MFDVSAIGRISLNGGTTVEGTAYISEVGIITCAHVVANSGDAVWLRWGDGGTESIGTVTERGNADCRLDDWAVLESKDEIPASPLPMSTRVISEHPFATFGFPKNWEEMGNFAHGTIGSRNAAGLYEMIGDREGFRIRPGFSGAPVWDPIQGAVVGIVVGSDAQLEQRVAFLIPIESLCRKLSRPFNIPHRDFTELDFSNMSKLSRNLSQNPYIAHYLMRYRIVDAVNDPSSRYWIYTALGDLGGRVAVEFLREAAISDDHGYARRGASQALLQAERANGSIV